MAFTRSGGILLHPTSLPAPYGIGDLGTSTLRWLDFLTEAGQTLWQILPLGPTGYGDSPYQSFSAFAGNPYLISLKSLIEEGLLPLDALEGLPTFSDDRVDYGSVIPFKLAVLERSYHYFEQYGSREQRARFAGFCRAQASWLEEFALFMACKEAHGGRPWNEWVPEIRSRQPAALASWRERLQHAIAKQRYWQWLFFEQWGVVKRHAQERGIKVIGDIPIFVAYDSADTWANPELFYLDSEGNPTVIAGVPPDYFSVTGQRWGNPIYRWKVMAETGYAWWLARIRAVLAQVDIVRIDHFRGFEAYWEIPASEPTAVKGRWVRGPGQAFFDAVKQALGELPIIAEDLGVITPGVEALREDNGLPGMKVLQFAFAADAADPYLPHNYPRNCAVYTGTHDNDTTLGWYQKAPASEQDFVRRYLARDGSDIAWDMMRLAFASVAEIAVVPLQDVLRLGSEHRMNTPGTASGNWQWRFKWAQLEYWLTLVLREIAETYGRISLDKPVDTAYRQSITNTAVEDE